MRLLDILRAAVLVCLPPLAACSGGGFATHSGLSSDNFISVTDGKPTGLYVLRNSAGVEVCITNYGARIVSILTPDRDGRLADIVCGFEYVRDYRVIRQNFGALVGRYIGRIQGASFEIDGRRYELPAAGNGHCTHGGYPGFADRVWDVESCDGRSVSMRYLSVDGENGFPGNLDVKVTYSLGEDNGLEILYQAETDRATVLNLSNHSFFNLSGDLSSAVLGHQLRVASDSIAEYDSRKCVTGRFLPVEGTPFDFAEFHAIGERIEADDSQIAAGNGYDHTWQLNHPDGEMFEAAFVVEPASGRTMSIVTDQPGVHIYTANGLNGQIAGKGGILYPRRNSVCFETMHFADSPNKPQFPSTLLRPGEKFCSRTVFRFGTDAAL